MVRPSDLDPSIGLCVGGSIAGALWLAIAAILIVMEVV